MGSQSQVMEGIYWGRADFLFPPCGYWVGTASVIDLGGTLVFYNESSSPSVADAWALAQDWHCVGDALRFALSHQPQSSAAA